MAYSKKVKSPYGDLDTSSLNPHSKSVLVLRDDATWTLHRSDSCAHVPPSSSHFQIWRGWEEYMREFPRAVLETQHERLFEVKVKKSDKVSTEQLALTIFLYRCSKATSFLGDAPAGKKADGTPIRRSQIGNRSYKMLPMPETYVRIPAGGLVGPDGKKITGKQGMACYDIMKEVCGESLFTTEDKLKLVIEEKAAAITEKVDSAWRFFQFYRPIFVNAKLVEYQK